jgi:hypothetical protein
MLDRQQQQVLEPLLNAIDAMGDGGAADGSHTGS